MIDVPQTYVGICKCAYILIGETIKFLKKNTQKFYEIEIL